MSPEDDQPDILMPPSKHNLFLQKVQATGLLGLHISLILVFLLMVFAIFSLWEPLQEAGHSITMILGSIIFTLLSCSANIRSSQSLIKALRKKSNPPPVDYAALMISTASIFVMLALFIDFS